MPSKRTLPRYVIREISGQLTPTSGSNRAGGLSVSVHDAWNHYRTCVLYRSEDYGGSWPTALRWQLARASARAAADTLESWYVS